MIAYWIERRKRKKAEAKALTAKAALAATESKAEKDR